MAYSSIPSSKREVGKPIDQDLVDNIHDNLEDLNSRVNGISVAAGSNILANQLIEKPKDSIPIGTLVHGSLTESQFQSETDGGEWVLADGRNVAGSDWALLTGRSSLPDVRGRYLRAKDHGSGNNSFGDDALDSYRADALKSHQHDMSHGHGWSGTVDSGGNHAHGLARAFVGDQLMNNYDPISPDSRHFLASSGGDYSLKGALATDGFGSSGITAFGGGHVHGVSGTVSSHSGNTGLTGATETAPRSITESVFIKINRSYITTDTRLMVLRVAQQTTINNILVSPVVQGTSGSFQIDIKKGASPTTASQSIFQSGQLPTLAFGATSGATGLTDSNQNVVEAGQFIVVSVVATQAKLKEVHLFIAGDY